MTQKANPRAAMCIYCGEIVIPDTDAVEDIGAAHRELVKHDQSCPENPVVFERDRLRQDLRRFYHADGSYDECETAEEAKRLRLIAAQKIEYLEARCEKAEIALLAEQARRAELERAYSKAEHSLLYLYAQAKLDDEVPDNAPRFSPDQVMKVCAQGLEDSSEAVRQSASQSGGEHG